MSGSSSSRLRKSAVGMPEFHWSHVWDNKSTPRRMLKKARLLTRPALAHRDAPITRLRSRVVQILSVLKNVRFGPLLAAASMDGCFDHPAMKNSKSTAGMRRQSMLGREKVVNEPIGDLVELR